MEATPQLSGDKDPHLFLTALGKSDSPAVLQGNDLSAVVDKTAVQVKAIRPAKDDPLLFAVLVDISRSDAETAESVKQFALQLFQGLTGTQRQGYLVLFNARATASRAPVSVAQAKQELDSARFEGGTAVYDAIEQTCRQTLRRSESHKNFRRIIVLISDGEDNQSHVTHSKAEEAALEEGIPLFSVVTTIPESRGAKFLNEASQRTGGVSTDKGGKAVRLLLAAIDAQFEVTLAATQAGDGKLHSLKVKCTHKDVHIHAPEAVLLE